MTDHIDPGDQAVPNRKEPPCPETLDIFSGAVRRDDAIARVGAKYGGWVDTALAAIIAVDAGVAFTTDLLWKTLPTPPEPRAMGAVMTAARRDGLIRPTPNFAQSARPECHCRPVRIWRRV